MNEKQIAYLESWMENSRFNINRLREIKESKKEQKLKLSAQEKRDIEYYYNKLQIVNEIFKTLPTLK